eukprot:807572-Heterocapsa_arctica.AAC.1
MFDVVARQRARTSGGRPGTSGPEGADRFDGWPGGCRPETPAGGRVHWPRAPQRAGSDGP